MRITTAIAAAIAVVGAIAVSRWMPGKPRPSTEEIEALVALEIEAAERDLSMAALAGARKIQIPVRWNGPLLRLSPPPNPATGNVTAGATARQPGQSDETRRYNRKYQAQSGRTDQAIEKR